VQGRPDAEKRELFKKVSRMLKNRADARLVKPALKKAMR
jgi:hypothetical protein